MRLLRGFKLTWLVTGTPPIYTALIRNSTVLFNTTRQELLKIDGEGNYTCVAINKYGMDVKEISVFFTGKTLLRFIFGNSRNLTSDRYANFLTGSGTFLSSHIAATNVATRIMSEKKPTFFILTCFESCQFFLSILILSGLVLSCLVLSCLVLSCLVLSCLVLSCLVLSCLVLSCLVLSCLVLSCLVLSCLVLSCLILSYTAFL